MELPYSGVGVVKDGSDLVHLLLVVIGVLAGLEPDHAAAPPGVHLVVPAVVVQRDVAEELGLVGVPVCEGLRTHVLLDAEVPETSRVQGVLVDSAALVGRALWVDLVLEAGNVTERSAASITLGLSALRVAPDHIVQLLICGLPAVVDHFSLPVVTVWAVDVPDVTLPLNLTVAGVYVSRVAACPSGVLGSNGAGKGSNGECFAKHVLLVFFFLL